MHKKTEIFVQTQFHHIDEGPLLGFSSGIMHRARLMVTSKNGICITGSFLAQFKGLVSLLTSTIIPEKKFDI